MASRADVEGIAAWWCGRRRGSPKRTRSRLAFTAERPVRLTVQRSTPLLGDVRVRRLGQRRARSRLDSTPGSYVSIVREWATGDTVDVGLPMSLRTEALPGAADTVALFYGPIVLAGELGVVGLTTAKRYGPSAPPLCQGLRGGGARPGGRPTRAAAPARRSCRFRIAPDVPHVGVGQPRDVTLVPFYQASQTRYTVYWKMSSPRRGRHGRRPTRQSRATPRVIDQRRSRHAGKRAGARLSWRDHADWNSRDGTAARLATGWFSYEMKVLPDRPIAICGEYLGSEGRRRVFDVLVDGVAIATRDAGLPPHGVAGEGLPVPEAVTRGKRRVTVRFQPAADALDGVGVRGAGRGAPASALIRVSHFVQDSPPGLPLQSFAMHTLNVASLSLVVAVAASPGPGGGVRAARRGLARTSTASRGCRAAGPRRAPTVWSRSSGWRLGRLHARHEPHGGRRQDGRIRVPPHRRRQRRPGLYG